MQLIPNADYGVIGEGEITDSELVLALEEGRDISQVKGIIYRTGSGLHRTLPREAIDDLDALPWPDYESFDYFEVARQYSGSDSLAAVLTTSRSCPFQCTFCSTSGGGEQKKYRQRSLDSIFEELQYLVEHYQVKEVMLNDELFAVDEERLHEFCRRIAPFHLKWYVCLRIGKHIQLELLQEMYETGCVAMTYGLESADDRILKSMKKGITQKEMLRVLEITKEANLAVRGNFIFGDTEETLETAEYTMRWVEEHSDLVENACFAPIVLYPGSELYERAVRSKRITDTVQFIRDNCPLTNPSIHMDDETYQILVNEKIPAFAARFHRKVAMRHREELQERITPDYQNRRYKHDFVCMQCGNVISEYIHPTGMFQHHAQCERCGRQYDLFPGQVMLQQYEQTFSDLLGREGCAVWGMGESAQDIYYNNAFFRNAEDIVLVDGSNAKQKHGFHGKAVNKPDILTPDNCNILLCSVGVAAYYNICTGLKNKNIHLPKVIWLYEALLEDF